VNSTSHLISDIDSQDTYYMFCFIASRMPMWSPFGSTVVAQRLNVFMVLGQRYMLAMGMNRGILCQPGIWCVDPLGCGGYKIFIVLESNLMHLTMSRAVILHDANTFEILSHNPISMEQKCFYIYITSFYVLHTLLFIVHTPSFLAHSIH